jgi:hypothetical protein
MNSISIKALILSTLLIAAHGEALAGESKLFTSFSKEDWGRQIAYTMITGVDWRQTQTFTKKGKGQKEEKNIFLGKNPSRKKVDTMIGGSMLAHWVISYALPSEDIEIFGIETTPRKLWQYVWIGIGAESVCHNYHAGVRISF